MNKRIQVIKYVAFDLIGSFVAWLLFHRYRKMVVEPQLFGYDVDFYLDVNVIIGLVALPLFWVFLFFVSGFYRDVLRRSRLKELGLSLGITLLGSVIIFFLLLLDDFVASYKSYYHLFFTLLILQFACTYFPRLILTSLTTRQIRTRRLVFPTLIVGDGDNAYKVHREILEEKIPLGNKVVGYVGLGKKENESLARELPNFGNCSNIRNVIHQHSIDELILALDHKDNKQLSAIVNELLMLNVSVKATPSMYDFLTGRVKMSQIFGTPLIHISFALMPIWQQKIKQLIDLFASLTALLILLPVIIVIAAAIKITSRGPILFSQERVGQYGRPFNIYKFRSMYIDAEANGPALSTKNDKRITPLGRFLRKTRFDEIPNFWNVLKGDMSLVGPRPERQFYIDQIVKEAPHYIHLQKVKPGITSWGQVKYGYAENVEEMIERLKYDLLYIENMSLFVDFKIMIYTLITVFKGRGV